MTTVICDRCGKKGPHTYDRGLAVRDVNREAISRGWEKKLRRFMDIRATRMLCPECAEKEGES